MELKKCSNCKTDKDIKLFSKNKSKKDGLNTNCKECHKIYRDLYYVNNKEKEREQSKSYRRYPTHCSVCNKTVFRNPSQIESQSFFFCSMHCRTLYKNGLSNSGINIVVNGCFRNSKFKKLEYNIDYKYIDDLFNSQNGKCSITGLVLKLPTRKKNTKIFETASLDRIDSSIGYIKGNVQFVALGINYMKNKFSQDDVIKMIELIREIK